MAGVSGFFSESFFKYLRTRSIGKKFIDLLIVMSMVTWVAMAFIVASNFSAIVKLIQQANSTQIDLRPEVLRDAQVSAELQTLLRNTGADRVVMFRFHDGRTDTQGIHFLYASQTNEQEQPGVSSSLSERQSILLSVINDWMVKFLDNQCVYYSSISPNDHLYDFFHQVGTKSSIACPVVNSLGVLVGFVSVEYTTRVVSDGDLHGMEHFLHDSSLRLGGILSLTPNGG